MKKHWIFGAILLLVVAVLVVMQVTKEKEAKDTEQEVIKIGAILPLTGKLATMGEVEKNAMVLAAKEFKSDYFNVELLIEDGRSNPKDALTAAQNLLNIKKVDLLITSTTGASLAVEPVTSASKTNLLAFCMDPDIASNSPYVMRFYEGIGEEAKPIITYLSNLKDDTKIGFLYARVPAFEKIIAQDYLPQLESANKSVPYIESYEVGNSDFRSLMLKLKSKKINNLVLLGYGFEYPNIFNALKSEGLIGKIQIIGGWGFLYTNLESEQLEGIIVSGPEYVFKTASSSYFFNSYLKAFGKEPNFDAAYAYTMIETIVKNIPSKESLKAPLKELFVDKKFHNSIIGDYSFDNSGNMIISTDIGVYRNQQIITFNK